MTFIPTIECLQVEMVFTMNSQKCENVYHVHSVNDLDEAEMTAVASLFKTWWADNFQPGTSNSVSLDIIRVRDMSAQDGLAIEYATGLPLVGGSAGNPTAPNNVTLAIKWGTGHAGRSFRGRTFHIGLSANLVVDNRIASGTATAFADDYDALVTAVEGSGRNLVVVSKRHNNADRIAGVMTNILACSVDRVVDSQRRRLPGRGT